MSLSSTEAAKDVSWISKHKNKTWCTLITIVAVACTCGLITAGAHLALTGAFEASDAVLEEVNGGAERALLFPEADSFTQVSAPAIEGLNSVWQANTGEYVFDVQSDGYHGAVELMIGINTDGSVSGIQVVAEEETEGIGTNALTDDYLGSFAGMAASGTLTIEDAVSGETHMDGVSGATFTSTAVIADLNIAFEAYSQLGGN